MTTVMGLVQAAPQYAVAGYLIYLVKTVMGNASTDRGDYRADLDATEKRYNDAITAAEERHAGELTRLREAHQQELDGVRAELNDMRQRMSQLVADLDVERRARWRAEDVAAEARRVAAESAAAALTANHTN